MTISIPDFSDPFNETEATIRARVDGYLTDPDINTREGDFFQLTTEPVVKELSTGYDALNFLLRMSSPLYAEGIYLDYHGYQYDVPRTEATKAEGTLTITGTNGTLIPSGTRFSAPASSELQESIRFISTTDETITGGTASVFVLAETAGVDGNVNAGAVEVLEDPISGVTAVTNAADFLGGADIEDDEALRQRILDDINAPHAAGSTADLRRWALERDGVRAVTVVPVWEGPWTARVVLLGENNNPVSLSIVEDVQRFLTGPAILTDPSSAPTAAEGGAGNVSAASLTYRVTFLDDSGAETAPSDDSTPLTSVSSKEIDLTSIPLGPAGTVARRIYRAETVSDATNLQHRLVTEIADNTTTIYTDDDASVAGERLVPKVNNTSQWEGKAPIGMRVSVDTPVLLAIDVAATIVYESGYSLDGSGATIALEDALDAALEAYIEGLPPGGDVVYQHVMSTFFDVTGVYDVTALTVDGGTSNIALDDAQVAEVGITTYS